MPARALLGALALVLALRPAEGGSATLRAPLVPADNDGTAHEATAPAEGGGPRLANSAMTLRVVPAATAAEFGAACLDGSAPSMYVRTAAGATEWVLFLEGGGWCFGSTPSETLQSCAARSRSGGGSSSYNTASVPDYGGVLSSDPALNPRFHGWNMVFLKYCDGSSFGGGATAPRSAGRQYNDSLISFRGRANFDALIADLRRSFGMHKATEVILSGGSAGGLAVFYNLDHLADLLGPSVLLTGFPDAGFFSDAPVSKLLGTPCSKTTPACPVTAKNGCKSD